LAKILEEIRCESCGEEFISINDKEEAIAEAKEKFGSASEEKFSLVCEDCYDMLVGNGRIALPRPV
jgi:formylmethanofuran dehydrogenase subunit E